MWRCAQIACCAWVVQVCSLSLWGPMPSNGQNEAAVEEFKFALKSDAKSVPALDGLAKALIAQKRYSAAIANLKDAPADPVLQDDLAVAYSSNGDVAEAVKLLAQLVQQNPSSADRHARLGLPYTHEPHSPQ